jgi:phospholipid/cholesterol/gamma-HCH transport system permease protein
MSSATISTPQDTFIHGLGRRAIDIIVDIGDLTMLTLNMLRCLLRGLPKRNVLMRCFYEVGVCSLPVVLITGLFIGMVLAIQSYDQFHMMRMESRLGAIINVSLIKELGPVLAAVMLAGRVGGAMAAELGTMKVTEQIDALRALGANPTQYLVVPRFLACFLLIPMLTAFADAIGVLGGWLLSINMLGIDSTFYWHHSNKYVTVYDICGGLLKSMFFGAAIAMIACNRGFNCGAGAEGVGRAATDSFVLSFVVILGLDFFLGLVLSAGYRLIYADEAATVLLETLRSLGGFV